MALSATIAGEILVSLITLIRPSRALATFSGVNWGVTTAVRRTSMIRSNSRARPCIVIVIES